MKILLGVSEIPGDYMTCGEKTSCDAKSCEKSSRSPGQLRQIQHKEGLKLLDRLLAGYGIASRPTIEVSPSGKPYFTGTDSLHFSISHSGRFVAAALGPVPLGLDLERERKLDVKLRRRFLDNISEEQAVREWTRREAYGKLTGEGFFFDRTKKVPRISREYEFIRDGVRYLITLCALNSESENPKFDATVDAMSGAVGFIPPLTELPEDIAWY